MKMRFFILQRWSEFKISTFQIVDLKSQSLSKKYIPILKEKGDTFRNRKCLLFYAISNPK